MKSPASILCQFRDFLGKASCSLLNARQILAAADLAAAAPLRAERAERAASKAAGAVRAGAGHRAPAGSGARGPSWRSTPRSNRSPAMLSETREKVLDLKRRFEALRGHL
jgi:hypothetical protein